MKNKKTRMVSLIALGLLSAASLSANDIHYYQSGSTGADGVFDPVFDNGVLKNVPQGTTYTYEDTVLCVNLTLNPTGTFNFTTVHIPGNVRVRFIPNVSNTPVTILASGDVIIEGEIDATAGGTQLAAHGPITMPGPGGFPGGDAGEPGNGPYAGISYNLNADTGPLQLPLTGGSGGFAYNPSGGGGGGGVLYLASSGKIEMRPLSGPAVNGVIMYGANASTQGGGGSGGLAIYANEIVGPWRGNPGSGIVSTLKSTSLNFRQDQVMYPRSLLGLGLPSSLPSAAISAVGGTAIPENVLSSDVFQVAQSGPNKITIQTHNLPPGIVFDVTLHSLSPQGSQTGTTTVSTFPTSGSFASASADATSMFGNGITFITAVAKAPVNLAFSPAFHNDRVKEAQIAINSEGKSSIQFVTEKGAHLSYEAAMRLAVEQNRWSFVRQFTMTGAAELKKG